MKNFYALKRAFLFFLLSGLLISIVYSQNETLPDSLQKGRTYRFVLYDDSEIIGKVIYWDSIKIKVQDERNDIVFIVWDNLLYYSPSITPSKYNFTLSLMGGVSLYTNGDHSYYYSHNMQSGINVDLAGIYYISDTKALKFDAGYSFLKAKYGENVVPAIYPYYPNIYEGGDVSNYSLKGNFLLGSFKPANNFLYYGSLGLGIHVSNQDEINEQYYSSYDSTYLTRDYPSSSELNAVFSLGGGLAYRFSKHLGVHAEIEYNLITSRETYSFFNAGRSYFPMRIGVIYAFY